MLAFSTSQPLRSQPDAFTMPFHLIAKLILVEATVEGKQGLFILDTGMDRVVLNTAHFPQGAEPAPGQTTVTISNFHGSSLTARTDYYSLQLGELRIRQQLVLLANLSHLEKNRNVSILGLIGYPVLRDFEIVMDYQAKELTFFRLDKKGNRRIGTAYFPEPAVVVPIQLADHMPCLDITVGREQLLVGLDSGAGINVFAAQTSPLFYEHASRYRPASVRNLDSRPVAAEVVLLDSIGIAGITYPPMRAIFQHLGNTNPHLARNNIQGLLGYEFLRHHKTAINYRKKELSIWLIDEVKQPLLAKEKK